MSNTAKEPVYRKADAEAIAIALTKYWHKLGYTKFKAEVVPTTVPLSTMNKLNAEHAKDKVGRVPHHIYSITSNLGPNGYPPL